MKLTLKLKSNKMYIDFSRYYKSNCPYSFVIITGARGTGKTTNCLRQAIEELNKEENKYKVFYYIRRYP